MFGKEYSNNIDILMSSFVEMKRDYKKNVKKQKSILFTFPAKLYIKLFGIPEVGFQLRSLYFRDFVSRYVKKNNVKKSIDAGSGIGVYVFWLASKLPNSNIIGIEIDKNKLDFSKDFSDSLRLNNAEFKLGDLSKSIKIKDADMVVSIDVLEHIKNYKKALNNFYNILNDKGLLFIHVPQENQKRIFKSLEKWKHEDHVHEGFKPKEMKEELEKIGFKVIEIRETFGFFGKLAWELNHLFLKKGFIFSGIFFPLLYLLAKIDLIPNNKNGLGMAIVAKK